MYEVQFIFCSLFQEEIEFFKYSVKQMYGIIVMFVIFFFLDLRRIRI
jgi:hypothetical protein